MGNTETFVCLIYIISYILSISEAAAAAAAGSSCASTTTSTISVTDAGARLLSTTTTPGSQQQPVIIDSGPDSPDRAKKKTKKKKKSSRPRPVTCPICDTFLNPKDLEKHIQDSHASQISTTSTATAPVTGTEVLMSVDPERLAALAARCPSDSTPASTTTTHAAAPPAAQRSPPRGKSLTLTILMRNCELSCDPRPKYACILMRNNGGKTFTLATF